MAIEGRRTPLTDLRSRRVRHKKSEEAPTGSIQVEIDAESLSEATSRETSRVIRQHLPPVPGATPKNALRIGTSNGAEQVAAKARSAATSGAALPEQEKLSWDPHPSGALTG